MQRLSPVGADQPERPFSRPGAMSDPRPSQAIAGLAALAFAGAPAATRPGAGAHPALTLATFR